MNIVDYDWYEYKRRRLMESFHEALDRDEINEAWGYIAALRKMQLGEGYRVYEQLLNP